MGSEQHNVMLSARIPQTLFTNLTRKAKTLGTTRTAIVRHALTEWLTNNP